MDIRPEFCKNKCTYQRAHAFHCFFSYDAVEVSLKLVHRLIDVVDVFLNDILSK